MSVHIPIILGTDREGRQSQNATNFLKTYIETHLGERVTTEIVDVREMKLYEKGYDGDLKEANKEYTETIQKADGLIIVVPEYNHGYPGRLKSALDLLFEEYHHKSVGMAGVSAGGFGGTRVIENLLPVVRELRLAPIGIDFNFSRVQEMFTEDGELKEEHKEKLEKKAGEFMEELIWMTEALKAKREG